MYTSLTTKLFKNDPYLYYYTLLDLKRTSCYNDDKNILNDLKIIMNDLSSKNTLSSSPIIWLIYCTGNCFSDKIKNSDSDFFADNLEIDNQLGIALFDLMYLCGARLDIKNKHNQDVIDLINLYYYNNIDDIPVKRTNNEKFVNYVYKKYIPVF